MGVYESEWFLRNRGGGKVRVGKCIVGEVHREKQIY